MFETITRHCEQLGKSSRGISDLLHDLHSFMETHPEMNLKNYRKILEEYGLEWSSSSIENADIDGLDSRGILI